MKYAIVIPDGAADELRPELGGKTPLEAAQTPEMDRISREGVLGLSRNVPDRFLPASDVATLSLFGYDPEVYYTGRAPLEAAAMGLKLGPGDWAIRCNLMTALDDKMTDFTAGHISSEEGKAIIATLQHEIGSDQFEFHPGVSYRNLLIYRGSADHSPFDDSTKTTPPHDVPDQPASEHLPTGKGAEMLRDLMAQGAELIRDHPVNKSRISQGKRPANTIWLWGQGRAPNLPSFRKLHGIKGAIVSAVDLVRGVGALAGWTRIDAEGATGYLDTNYRGKGEAGIAALEAHDIVCVHIEAPDEASHEGKAAAKVEAIEQIDREIVGPLRKALETYGEWRIVVSPDHSTMLRTRAHDRAPVPWAMMGAGVLQAGSPGSALPYNEIAARTAGRPFLEQGWRLMELLLAK